MARPLSKCIGHGLLTALDLIGVAIIALAAVVPAAIVIAVCGTAALLRSLRLWAVYGGDAAARDKDEWRGE